VTVADAFDAVVIGAGPNGLAAAATLAAAGKRTLVLEAANAVGGHTRSIEFAPGFRAAPLALTAEWVPPTVVRQLGLSMPPIVSDAPISVVAADDGLTLPTDISKASAAIRPRSDRDAARWEAFADRIGAFAGFLGRMYDMPAPDIETTSAGELGGLAGLAWHLRRLGRDNMAALFRTLPMSVNEFASDWFESPMVQAAVATAGVRDIRQGPRSGGTAFVLLHHLVGAIAGAVGGRGYWRDGPDAIGHALEAVACARGVAIRTSARVEHILVRDAVVTGVVLDSGEAIAAPMVLSGADPERTLLGMIEPEWLDPEFLHAVRNIKFRGATAYVLFALETLPQVAHLHGVQGLSGSVSLSRDPDTIERAYDATKYGRASETPHVEITATTLRWSSHAPSGNHVLVARATYAPFHLRDGAWDQTRKDALAERVTQAIAAVAPGFADAVLHRAVLTPLDLEREFLLTEGAASHGELTLDQVLFMRPVAGWARYAMPVHGLFLCGSGTHPGPGIAGMAGVLAAREATKGR